MKYFVIKRNGEKERFSREKIENAVRSAFNAVRFDEPEDWLIEAIMSKVMKSFTFRSNIKVETIQDIIEETLMREGMYDVVRAYIVYRAEHKKIRDFVENKMAFIEKYKQSNNTANATIDDNSNVNGKNIGILNSEIHKEDNIRINRAMVTKKLKQLFPEFDSKNYIRDLEHHIIYKHDENSFAGAISPYCVSMSMYPFLENGLKEIGGLSAAPKNLDSYCGMYINLIFAVSAQFAGAVATSEVLIYFDWFARKEWGDDYFEFADNEITSESVNRKMTIRKQIYQYFQQILYSINQPAAARGLQSAFVNFSIFDKAFFDGMFDNFMFPDYTKPTWESFNWLQKEFLHWFNQERLKTILTFPVVSVAMVYKDGKFLDEDMAKFVAKEYAEGNSFFTYISDTVDSLSSCCRLKNKVQNKEFNFTNGNMGVMTGSKSVITLNLNRIIQDWAKDTKDLVDYHDLHTFYAPQSGFKAYLEDILQRVYKYHIAYNELLWDMYDSNLLPIYKAGFIHLDKQYLTIGLNGLNQAAEFMGITCNDNEEYRKFCQHIFSTIKDCNTAANGVYFGHKITLNTEMVPAESLAIKNYNWDKKEGYVVPEDINLYASYIFKPNDQNISIPEKIRLHGRDYIGDYLDGGAAAHLNLSEHLSEQQYYYLLHYAAERGCQYFTFNVPNSECEDCGFITKVPIDECPKCKSHRISQYDRIIGYLTKIKNWSEGRQIEQKKRIYHSNVE